MHRFPITVRGAQASRASYGVRDTPRRAGGSPAPAPQGPLQRVHARHHPEHRAGTAHRAVRRRAARATGPAMGTKGWMCVFRAQRRKLCQQAKGSPSRVGDTIPAPGP